MSMPFRPAAPCRVQTGSLQAVAHFAGKLAACSSQMHTAGDASGSAACTAAHQHAASGGLVLVSTMAIKFPCEFQAVAPASSPHPKPIRADARSKPNSHTLRQADVSKMSDLTYQ